jgi:polyvinyl alcohol dehydrogenase (cytochrome)
VTFQNNIYFPDWSGNLYSANAQTGAINWSYKIRDSYLPPESDPKALCRTTVAIDPNEKLIIFGTRATDIKENSSPYIVAVNLDGNFIWATKLDDHPHAIITQSATIYDGGVYVGVSSREEAASASVPNYACCNFRGSFAKLDLKTGAIIWKQFLVPDNGGRADLYSGNAVWGSAPAIDPEKKLVYIATGNNYNVIMFPLFLSSLYNF